MDQPQLVNATSPPGPEWIGYDMTQTLSSFYWGTIVSMVLSGITILQAWIYFPGRDKIGVRVLAVCMITMELASTVLCADGMYVYLIPHFGSVLPFGRLVKTLSAECYLSVTVTFISQLYFGWQIYTVTRTKFLKYGMSSVVALFSTVAYGGGICCSSYMILDDSMILGNRSYRFAVAVGIANISAAISDVIATITLSYALGIARTGFNKRTDSLIKSVIILVIERGIFVSLVQVVFVVLFFGTASHLYWLALHANLTRVYANTFFVMLNGRDRLLYAPEIQDSSFLKMSRSYPRSPRSPGFKSREYGEGTGAGTDKTYITHHDLEEMDHDHESDPPEGLRITMNKVVITAEM